MSTDTQVHPGLLDAMRRELAPVAEDALRAKGVAYACRETLIELAGKSGKNGTIGRMRKDMDYVLAEYARMRALITRLAIYVLGAAAAGSGGMHLLLR